MTHQKSTVEHDVRQVQGASDLGTVHDLASVGGVPIASPNAAWSERYVGMAMTRGVLAGCPPGNHLNAPDLGSERLLPNLLA